jgi:exodeoxyribonuclease VII large subunit
MIAKLVPQMQAQSAVSPLTVTQLTAAIKRHLEHRFASLEVQGEISNFKEQASGHLYFTLKDASSQISAVFFKGNARGLTRLPKDGDQVIVKGELSVYPPRGNYQLLVRELAFAGVGELLLRFHALKQQVEQRGWSDPARKRKLPPFPRTIGVVTSPTGAVIQDILHVLSRRLSGFHLILNPVSVQGTGAAQEIAAAIEQFNRYKLADVLIVGRGGGSLEDLWAFNEESVARAIYTSEIPVISAVGHETDFSIADFVADVRAPTPSAAAEIVMKETAQHLDSLKQMRTRCAQGILSLLKQRRGTLSTLQRQALALRPQTHIQTMRHRFTQSGKQADSAVRQHLQGKRERLARLAAHLKAIDPRTLLTKGYCILFRENAGSVILSAKAVEPQEKVRVMLSDGHVLATVDQVV